LIAPMRRRGFTLIELMVVVAIIAILALITLPSLRVRLVRGQIVESAALIDAAKAQVAAAWQRDKRLPADNTAAGLPAPTKMVGNFVTAIEVEGGTLHVRFGGAQANAALREHVLSLRPAVVADAPVVPIAWVCGRAPVPAGMSAAGNDRTDLPDDLLPLNCRSH
jgi:type IV pilus assembly protein PilA